MPVTTWSKWWLAGTFTKTEAKDYAKKQKERYAKMGMEAQVKIEKAKVRLGAFPGKPPDWYRVSIRRRYKPS